MLSSREQISGNRSRGNAAGTAVNALARQAIAALAARNRNAEDNTRAVELRKFCNALVHSDARRRHFVLASLITRGATVEEIIERYIPDAARALGEGWVDDNLSFADVTIGASRLQELVHQVGADYVSRGDSSPTGHTILLSVPDFEDHTLGIFLAAERFRRAGFWVHIELNSSAEALAEVVKSHDYAFVGLSSSSEKSFHKIAGYVATLKNSLGKQVPIVLGGGIADLPPTRHTGILASMISNDINAIVDGLELGPQHNGDLIVSGTPITVTA